MLLRRRATRVSTATPPVTMRSSVCRVLREPTAAIRRVSSVNRATTAVLVLRLASNVQATRTVVLVAVRVQSVPVSNAVTLARMRVLHALLIRAAMRLLVPVCCQPRHN
jgi:hypothetical protein